MAVIASRRSVMTLFSRPTEIHSHRTRLVLAEKNINIEIATVIGSDLPEDLMDLNPYHTVPTLVDRDLTLYDSRVIIEYLDERFPHPPLMPVDPVTRAQFRLALFRIETDWYSIAEEAEGSADGKLSAKSRKMLRESIMQSAELFAARPYFLSDEFSLVDCTIAPLLWRLPVYGVDLGNDAEAIEAYRRAIDRHPNYLEARIELGYCLLEAQRTEEALELLEAGMATLQGQGVIIPSSHRDDGYMFRDAVTRAVTLLEDSPHFNAGRGAVFNAEGVNELDASIMEGAGLNAGAVAAVRRVRNPVLLARKVMEESAHVMLMGEGAEIFAREHGIAFEDDAYFHTDYRWRQLQRARAASGPDSTFLSETPDRWFSTVGAVALDSKGDLAAATSTGVSSGSFERTRAAAAATSIPEMASMVPGKLRLAGFLSTSHSSRLQPSLRRGRFAGLGV